MAETKTETTETTETKTEAKVPTTADLLQSGIDGIAAVASGKGKPPAEFAKLVAAAIAASSATLLQKCLKDKGVRI